MKKYIYLIIIIIAVHSYGDGYQLCTTEDCNNFKSSCISNINELSDINSDLSFSTSSLVQTLEGIKVRVDWMRQNSPDTFYHGTDDWVNYALVQAIDASNQVSRQSFKLSVLRTEVYAIDCTQCFGENTNECCCCDYLPQILQSINDCYQDLDAIGVYLSDIRTSCSVLISQLNRVLDINSQGFNNISNILNYLKYELDYLINDVININSFDVNDSSPYHYQPFSGNSFQSFSFMNDTFNLSSMLFALVLNSSESISSLNNYEYLFNYLSFPSYTNQVASHFSFFKDNMVVVRSPLDSSVKFSDYHAYLTNFYVEAVNDNNSASTNWFQRIETLIASLVFSDVGESSNTVNSSYGPEDPDGLIAQISDSFGDLENEPKSSLFALRDTSQSLVSSIRKFSNSFSDASMPGTVRLITIGSSPSDVLSSDSGDSIEFNTSDGGVFFEMCRCVTTIIWTLGGIILLVVFLSWSSRTSYKLFLFCWDVFNGIFSK